MPGLNQIIYSCTNCEAQFPKWQGRCPECGKWGTVELGVRDEGLGFRDKLKEIPEGKTVEFGKLKNSVNNRLMTGIEEFDRILGGGIVSGSLILLGGDPGIGKSTLVLQIAEKIKDSVLYVSGEESAQQVKLRLDRLGLTGKNIDFLAEENVEVINKTLLKNKPKLAIIDSIQTVATSEAPNEAGSITQVKASCVKFLEIAKKENIPIILVGHVTKEGQVAGPRALEHLVDVVLYLEGDQYHELRLLRGAKNRFGSTNEVGIFEMQDKGLVEVKNPSEIFLANRSSNSGSCIAAVLEGKRIFLIEVQALVTKTVFGYPVRKSSGFDNNRLQMLVAVLSKRAKLPLGSQDIHVNVVGGLKIKEPAIDLAVCLAIVSAFADKPLQKDLAAIGEVGLGGEIRTVSRLKERIKEAKKLGFSHILSNNEAKDIKEALRKII
jgi:DNA repair protein RadA/Sms